MLKLLLHLLVLFAVIARTVGCRLEGQVPDAFSAHHTYVHVLSFHNVAALPDRRYRLAWLVDTHGERCRRDGKRLTEPAARVRRDRKLHATRDADLAGVTFARTKDRS